MRCHPGVVAIALFLCACTRSSPTSVTGDTGDASSADAAKLADAGDARVTDGAPDRASAEDALPASSSDDLTTRAKHLLEAISHDDPDLCLDILFPRDAYVLSKDAPDPGKHWDNHVLSTFKSQIHALHKRTKGIERAEFTSFEIGQPVTQTVPKKHDMKRSLWKVRHSHINFTTDGKPQRIDLADMLSWGGAWYVLKLR